MNIVLYYNKSEKNKIDKSIEQVISLSGNFRDSVSILRPRIVIELDNFIDFNYVYIEDLHRYYFVDRVICVRDKIYLIECSVDVLMTYKEGIRSQTAFINRSSFIYDDYLKDNVIASEPNDITYKPVSTENCIKFDGYNVTEEIGVDEGQYDNIIFSGVFTQAV